MYTLFCQSCENFPEASAFILSNKEIISYTKAHELVELWSKFLISAGIRQGDRVVIFTVYEDLHPFIHLALDKLNATAVPFDKDIPKSQFTIDIQKLNPKKILIDKELSQQFSSPQEISELLMLDGIMPVNPDRFKKIQCPDIQHDADIPNYIVASSGVTDHKKWIPIGSAGLIYWANIERKLLKLSPDDRVLCTRSPAYDARISEYVRAFAMGSTLVLLSSSDRKNFYSILEACEREQITCLILIASQLSLPDLETVLQRLAKVGLKHLMVTGDACTLRLKKCAEAAGINLWNCYGPTEATFGMSILCVNGLVLKNNADQEIVPISMPHTENVKFHLHEGCLYLESPFLSPGYIGDEERTHQYFPKLSINGRTFRVFNTENKFSVNGNYLVFEGRINDEAHCKISGVKLTPFSIQDCMEKFNDVMGKEMLQVYVVIKPWLGIPKPFAYIVKRNEFSSETFARFLRQWLRKEEMPIVILLDTLPRLLASEKIDRRSLISRIDLQEEFFFNEGKRCETNSFSKIWCDVLGLDYASDEQDFLLMGGDSILLFQLFTRIKEGICSRYTYQDLVYLPDLTFKAITASIVNLSCNKYPHAHIKPLTPHEQDGTNYFCLPTLLGDGYFGLKHLAKLFIVKRNEKCNVYGLTDPGFYDSSLLPTSYEEAADRYVQAIKTIQKNGPYKLMGFSYGGTLAYYVAHNLIKQGEEVSSLDIIDGFPPELYQKLPYDAHRDLLEELLLFVINVLNNNYYKESIKPIKLKNFHKIPPLEQITRAFDFLDKKIQNAHSGLILGLARRHLCLMLDSRNPARILVEANLHLSTPNQTYLNVIDRLENIVKDSPEYHYFSWNNYFDKKIALSGARAPCNHIDLLKREGGSFSFFPFWQTAHMHALKYKWFDIEPFYSAKESGETKYLFQIYSVTAEQTHFFKNTVGKICQIENSQVLPIYEQIAKDMKTNDRICIIKYVLIFEVEREKNEVLQKFLCDKKIQPLRPVFDTNEIRITAGEDNCPSVKLHIFCFGRNLMTLYFKNPFNLQTRQFNSIIYENEGTSLFKHPQSSNEFILCFSDSNKNIFEAMDEFSPCLCQFIFSFSPFIVEPNVSLSPSNRYLTIPR